MQKTILQKLYNGELAPYEHMMVGNREFLQLNEKLTEMKKPLLEKLSDDDRKIFEQIEEIYTDSSQMEIEEAFSRGYKLGVRLTSAAFDDEEKIAPPLKTE